MFLDTGYDFRLTCKATGKPKPSVEWLKNGQPFTERFGREPVSSIATVPTGVVDMLALRRNDIETER